MGEFFGNLNFSQVIYVNEKSPAGVNEGIRSYVITTDGEINFISPEWVMGAEYLYQPLSITFQQIPADFELFMPDITIKVATEKMIALLNMTGKSSRVRLLIGNNPGSVFKGPGVPYADIFDASDWDEATLEFMQTGNYKLLPIKTINGITGYLLPAIRISVADSVTATP